MRRRGLATSLVVVLLGAGGAAAHSTSTGLAVVGVDGATVTCRLTLVVGELTESARAPLVAAARGERDAVAPAVALLRDRLSVGSDVGPCPAGRASLQSSGLDDGRLTVDLTFRCPGAPARLTVRDDTFDVLGSHHRTLARVETRAGVREVAFLPDARVVTLALGGAGAPATSFLRLGVEHILTGWDHLAFLGALLLGGGGALALLKVVTAFTVAHSVSLAAAVLGLVRVPDRLVESVIAGSIAWVAIENLRGRGAGRRSITSFAFGLVHGLGFASALTPLALPGWSLARALLGFNVGVEAGQAAVIALALPGVWWLRRQRWEARVLRALSLALAAVGTAWLVERLLLP